MQIGYKCRSFELRDPLNGIADELIIKVVNYVPDEWGISNKILYLIQQQNGFADENKRAEHGGKAPVPAKGLYLLQ